MIKPLNTQNSLSGQADEELIRGFLHGDVDAFHQLVIRYKDIVYGICLRMLGNVHDADDCAQETFIKVYKNLHRFQFRSSFSTWLYRIAVNACKNKTTSAAYRERKRIQPLEKSSPCEEDMRPVEIKDERFSPSAAYEQKEMRALIYRAIASLPYQQRVLIVLCDLEGRSYAEIVEITGLKLGTVKSKLARARHKIRNRLERVMKNEMFRNTDSPRGPYRRGPE